jgi:hypothetical protein
MQTKKSNNYIFVFEWYVWLLIMWSRISYKIKRAATRRAAYTNFLFIGKLKDQSQWKDSSHKNKKCLDQINLLSSLWARPPKTSPPTHPRAPPPGSWEENLWTLMEILLVKVFVCFQVLILVFLTSVYKLSSS